MLSSIKRLIRQVTFGESDKLNFAEDDHRLAAAALLCHVIAVDGIVDESERTALKQVLRSAYAMTDEAANELIEAAHERDSEAVDLYGFTSVLKRKLDLEERLKVVEMMWKLVYADGTVHEFEDNTIWRVAELLGVSSRDRLSLRRKVARHMDVANQPELDEEKD